MAANRDPQIIFANANFAQSANALRSPEWFSDYAHDAGYDGIEYTTLHTQLHGPERLAGAVVSGEVDLNSLHMSYRTNSRSRDTNQFGGNKRLTDKIIDSPLGGLLMPEMFDSSFYIGQVQMRLEEPVPVILYPQKDAIFDNLTKNQAQAWPYRVGSKALFQPTDHVARLVEARTMDEFLENMFEERGYDGFCLDTFHARRQYGQEKGVVSSQRNFDELLSYTRAVHLSLNRLDFAKAEPQIPTAQDLNNAIEGNYQGYVKDVLDAVRENPKVKFVVVEAASNGVKQVAKEHKLTLRDAYWWIASNLRIKLSRNIYAGFSDRAGD